MDPRQPSETALLGPLQDPYRDITCCTEAGAAFTLQSPPVLLSVHSQQWNELISGEVPRKGCVAHSRGVDFL